MKPPNAWGCQYRRSGSFWAIKYRDQQGDQHWEGGFATRGAAQERLNVVLPEVDTGRYIPRQDATFEAFANQWLAGRLRVRGSTASAYGSMIRQQLIPRLGMLRVSDVRGEHLQAAIAARGQQDPRNGWRAQMGVARGAAEIEAV